MKKKLLEQLEKLHFGLSKLKNQNQLITELQYHTSFVSQSESLTDYIAESRLIIEQVSRTSLSESDREIIEEKLSSQLTLLSKLLFRDWKSKGDQNKTNYRSQLSKMHAQMAQYQGYIRRFDDNIRQLQAMPFPDHYKINHIQQRRQNCLNAIEKLEQRISRLER